MRSSKGMEVRRKRGAKRRGFMLASGFFAFFLAFYYFSCFAPNAAGSRAASLNRVRAAEERATSYRIGILQLIEHPSLDASRRGFLDGLAELGLVEGKNLSVDYRNAQGEQANAQTIAQQFASKENDLTLAIATPAAQAAANILHDSPLLFTAVTDPVDAKLLDDPEHPSGNVTGTSDASPIGQQMALLKRLVPKAETLAILYTAGEANSVLQAKQARTEAEALGLRVEDIAVTASNEIQQATLSASSRFDAIYIPTDNTFASAMATVRQAAVQNRCPVITGASEMVEEGGLATVGLDYYELGKLTARQAAAILLDGKAVRDIPVGYLEEAKPIVNLEVAKAIGLEIPADILGELNAEGEGYPAQSETPGAEDPQATAAGIDLSDRSFSISISQFIEHAALDAAREGFIEGLAAHGLVEGRNLRLKISNAQGDQSNAATIASQIKSERPDLVLGIATPSALALANAIDDIPILFTAVTDPVEAKLVKRLEQPGGNISGTIDAAPIDQQVKLLLEIRPNVKKVGILYTASEINSELQARQLEAELKPYGIQLITSTVSASNEIMQSAQSLAGKCDAIYIPTDNLVASAINVVSQAVKEAQIPLICAEKGQLEGGGHATVGIDYRKLGRLTADMAAEILSGRAEISSLPVCRLQDLTVRVNAKAAREAGIQLPPTLLGQDLHLGDADVSAPEPTPAPRKTRSLVDRAPQLLLAVLIQGLLWGLLAVGVYITFRLLGFPDLTVDGSFATGGVICAVAINAGRPPLLALLLAVLGGLIAGFITGFLHTKMKIPDILASILCQLALYSINLRISGGKPNISLLGLPTLFSRLQGLLHSGMAAGILISVLVAAVIVAVAYWFFGTEIGMMLRATGGNPRIVRAVGVSTDHSIMLGLMLSNALVALSGALVTQQQGFGDVGMGQGAIVIGLAAIIIGEVLFLKINFCFKLIGVFLGSVIYRLIYAFVIELGMDASDMKLITAAIVAIALFLPVLRGKVKEQRQRNKNKEGAHA